jgi:hypothetical protein
LQFNFRRDTTLDVSIENKSVGLNVLEYWTGKVTQLVGKQDRVKMRRNSEFEEQKSGEFGKLSVSHEHF